MKTIRSILEELMTKAYYSDNNHDNGDIDQALKDIEHIIDEATRFKVKLSDDTYDKERVLEILDEFNEYFQSNLREALL